MKIILLFVFLVTALSAHNQDKDEEMTILEKLFSLQPGISNKVTQEKDDRRRELVLCKSKDEKSFKKYILTEYGYEDMVTGSACIVSKEYLRDRALFDIKLGGQPVIYLDNIQLNDGSEQPGKMTIQLREEYIDVTDPFSKLINKLDEADTIEICVGHWWMSRNEQTGEVTDIEYLGSDCYVFGYLEKNSVIPGADLYLQRNSNKFKVASPIKNLHPLCIMGKIPEQMCFSFFYRFCSFLGL